MNFSRSYILWLKIISVLAVGGTFYFQKILPNVYVYFDFINLFSIFASQLKPGAAGGANPQ
jgi:hypothetical protein